MRILLDNRYAVPGWDGVCQTVSCMVAGKGGSDHDDFPGIRDHAIGEPVQEGSDFEVQTRGQLVKGEADEPAEKEHFGQHPGVLPVNVVLSAQISIDSRILSDPMSAVARLPDSVMV